MTSHHLHTSLPGTIEVNDETAANTAKKSQPVVKFGTNSAVAFDKLQPITEMTPMPLHVVQELFPFDGKKETAEEQDISQETKQNVAMLAEWDDLFDCESEQSPKCKRGRKCTPYKSKNTKRPSNSRRDSVFFSKEGIDMERKSLTEDSYDEQVFDAVNDVEAEPNAAAAEVDFGGIDNIEAEARTAGVDDAVEVVAPPIGQPGVATRAVRMIRVSIMILYHYQRSFECTHSQIPTLFDAILSRSWNAVSILKDTGTALGGAGAGKSHA